MTTAESHFTQEAGGTPSAEGLFARFAEIAPIELLPGLQFRPVRGERMLANQVFFAENAAAPVHVHEEEQIVIVINGELEFELDGNVRTMRPGDIAVVPSWVPHGAHTTNNTCTEVDVFNPPRRTLLDHATKVNSI